MLEVCFSGTNRTAACRLIGWRPGFRADPRRRDLSKRRVTIPSTASHDLLTRTLLVKVSRMAPVPDDL